VGDRVYIANATGCSSIYGGNLPTTPYAVRQDGRGPCWANSLFEDNAEFGFGMRVAVDKFKEYALELVGKMIEGACCGATVEKDLLVAVRDATSPRNPASKTSARASKCCRRKLASCTCGLCAQLKPVAEYLVNRAVWIVGGDGWAYDIGYGGLDHVLASGRNVKVLVLDTEVYSNTGGQASKSTPMAPWPSSPPAANRA